MCAADSLQSSKGSQRQLLLLHSLNQRRQKQRNYSTNRISDGEAIFTLSLVKHD